jgi:hypothetical protein
VTVVIAYQISRIPEHAAPWIVERRRQDAVGAWYAWEPVRNGKRTLHHRTKSEAEETAEDQRRADRAAATRLGVDVVHE